MNGARTRAGVYAAALAAASACTGTARATDNLWNGTYAGVNTGDASSNTCDTWRAGGSSAESAAVASFYQPDCGTHGAFLLGAEVGDNFQIDRFVWGVGADLDAWRGSGASQTLKNPPASLPLPTGSAAPLGTYSFSGKKTPDVVGIFSVRVGYAGNEWHPYLRAGAVLAGGSQTSTLRFVPTGETRATASFAGSKGFASTGWAAGGGAEFGLYGPWSLSAEYLHLELGSASGSSASCAGSAADCAAFSGVSLIDTHKSFRADLIRIGVNYWFGYW